MIRPDMKVHHNGHVAVVERVRQRAGGIEVVADIRYTTGPHVGLRTMAWADELEPVEPARKGAA